MLFINYRNSKKLLDPLTEKIKLIDSASVEPQRTAADSRTGVYELDVLQAYYQNEIEKRENLNTLLEDEKQQVEKSLAQRELLLREIHHRVKNNLNIIASLLKLQSSSISDEQMKKHFMDAQNRVASMSLIHEKLYNHDLSGVHIKKYLDDLISQLIDTYRSPHRVVQTHIDVPDVHMPLDTAVPLGLIVNELITNSLEHGFDQLREGRIEILMREEGANYTLTISDNGVGLPADLDVSSSSSLGLSLVSTLAKQLKGSFEFFNDNGTVARITFRVIGG
jgi:two-component sensor histidine kinase